MWVALQWTSNPRVAALPLWTWLLTVLVFTFGGPGDDIVFGGAGIMEYAPVLLIALGALPRRLGAACAGAGATSRADRRRRTPAAASGDYCEPYVLRMPGAAVSDSETRG